MSQNLTIFLDKFFEDFSNAIEADVRIKLMISKYLQEGYKNREIIEKLREEKLIDNSDKLDSIKKIVSRIKKEKYTYIHQLPALIKTKVLVKMIIDKFPEPSHIGFPFEYWDAERMIDFIFYYFEFPGSYESDAKLKYDTIQKYINSFHHTTSSKIKEIDTMYYITFIKKKYINIPYDHLGNKQYTHLYYGAIFSIKDDTFIKEKEIYTSVVENSNYINSFKPFISVLLKDLQIDSALKPVIFIRNFDTYEEVIFRKNEDFHVYFKFHWYRSENLGEISALLKKGILKLDSTIKITPLNTLNQLQDKENVCSKITLTKDDASYIQNGKKIYMESFDEEKKFYLDKIHEIF